MSAWPDDPPPPSAPAAPASPPASTKPSRTRSFLGIAALVIVGQGLFFTGVILHLRAPKDAPAPKVLGVAAWQAAAAGFVSTLAGGLCLRKLV